MRCACCEDLSWVCSAPASTGVLDLGLGAGAAHPCVPSGCPWLLLGAGAAILEITRNICGFAGLIPMNIIILVAKSFVWPFLTLECSSWFFPFASGSGISVIFHWVALGLHRSSWVGSAPPWHCPCSHPKPRLVPGAGAASPAIPPLVLPLIKFPVSSGAVEQFVDVIPLLCQQTPPGLC